MKVGPSPESVRVVRGALLVFAVGTVVGFAIGLVRGFPQVVAQPPVDETATCVSPVPAHPSIHWISQEDARALVSDGTVIFVDTRPEDLFVAGHVTGAMHVPIEAGTISDAIVGAVRGGRMVVTYCDTASGCASSTRVAGLLAASGLADVRVLEGGFPQWLANGFPAEAGTCRSCP